MKSLSLLKKKKSENSRLKGNTKYTKVAKIATYFSISFLSDFIKSRSFSLVHQNCQACALDELFISGIDQRMRKQE